jgi:heat-inducible transcriptional repressor
MTLQKPPLPDASSAMADKSILGMNERVHMIFNRIVDRYLTSGSAVGSKAIATDLDHMLSSASIRSIMGELESAGLLFQPHTSAGRIPTQSGLRIFVNGLLEIGGSVSESERMMLDVNCQAQGLSFDEALSETSSMLSGLTSCAALVIMPKTDMIIKQVEFIPIEKNKALVVLVSSTGHVENRIMETPDGMPASVLIEAGNFINAHLVGKSLSDASFLLKELIDVKQAAIDDLTQKVAESGIAIWTGKNSGQSGNFILRGQANLLENVTAMDQLEQVRSLFHQLEEQSNALDVLATMQQAEGVQIFIGSENRFFTETNCSTIIAPYYDSHQSIIGAVGVIGPTRLDYARIIPMVNHTSATITKMLSERI